MMEEEYTQDVAEQGAEGGSPVDTATMPKGKREAFVERLKGRYPDKSYDDDDALFGQINDDYDDYEKRIGEHTSREDELVDLFNKDRRAAQFITDMAQGKDPIVELVRQIGSEGLKDMADDPAKLDELAEANKEWLERQAQNEKLEAEAKENMAATANVIEQILAEGRYTEEQIDEALMFLRDVFNDAIRGKTTRESIEMALKAVNHEADMTAAKTQGELDGRNAQIDIKLRKPQAKKGDGTAQLAGANNSPRSTAKESIFSLAADA